MARHEEDREDLLREATALVRRMELLIPALAEPVVVGFRRDGSASFFFGSQPVYQFNSHGELRRGYRQGRLLKAEEGHVIELERVRTATEVELRRRPLAPHEELRVLAEVAEHLGQLRGALEGDRYQIAGQVPAEADLVGVVRKWLDQHATAPVIATRPNAG